MLLRLLRSTGAQVIILIPVLAILLWLPTFSHRTGGIFLFDSHPMPSYKLINELIPVGSFLGTSIALLLVIAQAFLLVRLNTRFNLINNRTYMPAIMFVLLTATITDLQRLNPVIFSGFFLLLGMELMFSGYQKGKVAYEFFTASFFISLGATFYPYLLFFIFIVWVSLAILRPFNWREWLFSLMGFLLPWLFVFSYYYLIHNEPGRIITDLTNAFNSDYDFPQYSLLIYIFGGFTGLLILVSSQLMIKEFGSKKILPRKAFLIFLWLFINCLGVYLLVDQASVEIIFLAAIPLSFLFSHYFTFVKSNFWGETFITFLILLIILIQFNHQ
ncbi:MAG TPA: DUF6427 family protein [Bacteroidales bacterium]|nr:DUF6427 family protein [Bacteroidales bacterium]